MTDAEKLAEIEEDFRSMDLTWDDMPTNNYMGWLITKYREAVEENKIETLHWKSVERELQAENEKLKDKLATANNDLSECCQPQDEEPSYYKAFCEAKEENQRLKTENLKAMKDLRDANDDRGRLRGALERIDCPNSCDNDCHVCTALNPEGE